MLVEILTIFAWPVVVMGGLLAASLLFRAPLTAVLYGLRNRQLSYKNTQIGAEQQAQAALPEPSTRPTADEPALPAPATENAVVAPTAYLFEAEDNPYITELTALVKSNVEGRKFNSEEERSRWLYREGAKLEARIEFERIFRTMFQSQLFVLISANNALSAGGLAAAALQEVYSAAAREFPEFYKNYSQSDWLRYLTNGNLLVANGTQWAITNKGQLYLHYLTATGYGTRANLKL